MVSYARLGREECHSGLRLEKSWSGYKWPPVFTGLDGARSPNDGRGPGSWTVSARNFPTKVAVTDRLSPVEAPVRQHRDSWPKDSGQEGCSGEELLDGVRRAMERNPEVARAAVLQLLTFLTPPPAGVESAGARGGLAPWQKRKADRYLREHMDQPVRLNEVAEQVALSVSYFSRAFKESFGTTPHMHMVRLRVELAQELMLTTGDPLSQIALACGLAEQAHLSKLFRRLVGETPNAWRRRNLSDAQGEARSRRSTTGQSVNLGSGCERIAASL
jgi:AraC family transcriptional regulator